MSDRSGPSEIKEAEGSLPAADRNNSGWLLDSPVANPNFSNVDSTVLSYPPSWIHSEPMDYEGVSDGDSSDGSTQLDQSLASEYDGPVGAPDSEFIIPPFSSSPADYISSSIEHENFSGLLNGEKRLSGPLDAHISTPMLFSQYHSPTPSSLPRRRPFLVPISTQNPGSPASLSMTTLSPMSSRSVSFRSSQFSEQDSQCWEDDTDDTYHERQFMTKLHDLLLVVQREQRKNGYSRRLFRSPSDVSQPDTEIDDIRGQFTQLEYQPYSPVPAQASGPSSVKRKRTDASSCLDMNESQVVSGTSQDYRPFGRYRLIKRAASYQATVFGNAQPRHLTLDSPPSKRRRLFIRPLGTRNAGSSHSSSANSPFKARDASKHSARAASYRRAESLKAPSAGSLPLFSPRKKGQTPRPKPDDSKENQPPDVHHAPRRRKPIEPYTPIPLEVQVGAGGAAWVPTMPSTPSGENRRRVDNISTTPKPRKLTRKSDLDVGLKSPVPIIAPPKDLVWRMPLSPSAEAKVRLRSYLGRERQRDKRFKDETLSTAASIPPREIKIGWEQSLGLGKKTRRDCVAWLLTVIPKSCPELGDGHESPAPHSQSIAIHISSSTSSSTSTVSQQFDDPETELDFTLTRFLSTPSDDQNDTPPPEDPISNDKTMPSLSASARNKTSTEGENKNKDMSAPSFNLTDQLQHSPETRFHAVWMFLRYFWLIDYGTQSSGFDADGEYVYPGEDAEEKMLRSLLIWDAAVGSLALSVKLHRDFLDPLLPVYADEYLALAPHSIGMEDFENAQRDIFSALDYMLGDTPQPLMDELWRALPSLRQLLDFGSGKQHGWAVVMQHAWDKLFAYLRGIGFLLSPLIVPLVINA
ncbi:hypothetical protein BJ165DRAFT_1535090 [Panaeolus papilionaceus]|nr:hypothetical protein BJ165DRAFT_1535090 [Panaeolus papilionaceus]